MSTTLALSRGGVPIGSLEAYMTRIRQIPVLTMQEEQTLAEDLYYRKDLSSARQLVVSNLRFVVYIAQSYAGYGLALGDLIQEGNIGLMKAVKRFDPRMKVRLISFAVHWIRSEIQEFILRNWRIVKMATTKAKRKLFFNLRRVKKHLGWTTGREAEMIAQDLGVKPETVREMEGHLSSPDISFEGTLAEDNDSEGGAPSSRLPVSAFSDSRYDPARVLESSDFAQRGSAALQQALKTLDGRSQDIITSRWLREPKSNLKVLAARHHLSMERIRQLEQKAILQLRGLLEGYA